MVTEVIDILLEDYDGHAVISDWGIKEKGTLITDAVVALDNGEKVVQFWSGNPFEDKHAEQINVSFENLTILYNAIVNWL